MKFISYALAAALSISTTSPVVANGTVISSGPPQDKPECKSIVETAAGDERLKTLVDAVTAADLVETLSGDGTFTVFAPTNDAFDKLPEGTVDSLLESENKEQLTGILTYHVAAGKVMSDDLENGPVTTLNGADVSVDLADGVKINDSNVKKADIEACNGVIHLIDTVLIPPPPTEPETSSPTDTLSSKSGKSTAAKAAKASSTSAKAGKSDTDKTKTSSPTDTLSSKSSKSTSKAAKASSTSAKAGKSDTDKKKTSPSAKAAKANTPTTTTTMSADEPDEPEEKPDEDKEKPDEEEEDGGVEVNLMIEFTAALMDTIDWLISGGSRKLSNHLRG